jgi:4-amino-4-deoxy-L-arabinose transferase-like glycosyltransferase
VGTTALTCVALWLLALLPRLHAVLLGFVTPDEPSWVFRALRFSQALETQRWADTFQIGHPGVITMWAGALGLWWQRWRAVPGAAEHVAWIDRVAWVTPDNSALFDHLAPLLPPARLAMALLCSLGVAVAYLLSRRLWGHRVALAGAVTMALNPFLAALSGLLHVDAPATTFLLLSLLAWLVALKQETRPPSVPPVQPTGGRTQGAPAPWRLFSLPRGLYGGGPGWGFFGAALYALLSGLAAGLAILSKSPSVYVLAGAGLSALLFILLVPKRSWLRLGRIAVLGVLWTAGLVAALYSFPAMWNDPLGVLGGIYGLAGRHLDVPHGVSFYRGVAGGSFGPGFYPTVLLYRLTPVVLAGLVLALWATVHALWPRAGRDRVRAATLLSLWAFALGYTAFMTVAAKKFDRYLLPVFPVLDLLAAVGWVHGLRWLYGRRESAQRLPAQAVTALLACLAVAQLATALPSWPYLLDVYNPLAGGLGSALRTLAVGWGEGNERVAFYLSASAQVEGEQIIAAGSPVTLGPLVDGRVVVLDEASRAVADRVLITALDQQVAPQRVSALISGATLEHTVRVAGQEILWLYDARTGAEAEHLAHYGAPGDLVLCDAASPFCRGALASTAENAPWQGNVHLLTPANQAAGTEPEIVEALNQWSARHTRLWYLAYPAATSQTLSADLASPFAAAILRRQLESYATRLDHVDLGDVTATLYILPQEPRFEVSREAFSPIRFDGQLAVTGAALYDPQPAADEAIRFRLHWTAEAAPRGNYRAFIHLIEDDAGAGSGHLRQAGRGQEMLVDGRGWPTSYWLPDGSIVGADYRLGLPGGLPPGAYRLVLGLADVATDQWLPVLDAEGRIVGTTADLLPVQVGPAAAPPRPDAPLHLGHPSDATWAGLRLLGHSAPSHAQAGQRIVVETGWLGTEAAAGHPGQDLQVRLGLAGPSGDPALVTTLPLSRYPTSRWRAKEVIHELYDLRLPAEFEGGAYTLTLALLDGRTQVLPLTDGAREATLGTLRVSVQERLFALPRQPQQPLELSLTPAGSPRPTVALLGYDLAPLDDKPDRVSLTLYWRCEQAMEASYSVFVHLLDGAGRVQGQRDRVPMEGHAPTTGWIGDQIVVDAYEVPLNQDAAAGTYQIEVGMYNPKDMPRLSMVDAQGLPLPGDRYLLLEEVSLEPAP